jgi:hypothetical protein
MFRRSALVGLVSLCLSVRPSAAGAQDLSGRWYGEGYQPRGYTQWIALRRPGGAFSVEFREYRDCQLIFRETHIGRWSFENGIYATTATAIDGHPADQSNAYRVLEFGGGEVAYQHVEKGIRFKARKVSDDFDWPACDRDRLSQVGSTNGPGT